MAAITLEHLMGSVLAAAHEYFLAEEQLSVIEQENTPNDGKLEEQRAVVLRKGSECAVAIDGLADRAEIEFGRNKSDHRRAADKLAKFPKGVSRPCLERVRAVANAYKHFELSDKSLPISSANDLWICGSGYGIDGFGVGKLGGTEMLIKAKDGTWKYLGDVPCAIHGWSRYLESLGVSMPGNTHSVCNLEITI